MRILIISFDGLEYNWVEKLNLVGLKQVEYGKTDLSPILNNEKRKVKHIITDEVYATIVSGEKFIDGITGEGRVCPTETLAERNIKSLFNLPNSLSINVPSMAYNTNRILGNLKVRDYLHDEISLEKLVGFMYKEADELTSLALDVLGKKKLIMVYYHFTDELGHLSPFRYNKNKILQLYSKAEEITMRFKQWFLKFGDDVVLVLSDHGMTEDGEHSNHGFYSLNKPLGWKDIKVTELYNKIVALYNEA